MFSEIRTFVKYMSHTFDVIIIGGGIVGLSTAYALNRRFPHLRLAVVEKEASVARHQTGHNSGVIHSGIYYKPGSQKAQNCLRGYQQLIEFCDAHGIAYDLCGKIIAATSPEEEPAIQGLLDRARANGLTRVKVLSAGEANEIEPHLRCTRALHVPYTGIVSYPAVCVKLEELLRHSGVTFFMNTRLIGYQEKGGNVNLETTSGVYTTSHLVNCGGLYSDKIAGMGYTEKPEVQIIPFRGEYYTLRADRTHLVRHLIYPVPDPRFPFLGVHFTRMIDGGVEAGPNAVLAFAREGYTRSTIHLRELAQTLIFPGFHQIMKKYGREGWMEMRRSFSKKLFTVALQKLVPEVQESDLLPGGAGVRAQACDRDGNLLDDFCIRKSGKCVHVLNAPSPAATSGLSIGQWVADQLEISN